MRSWGGLLSFCLVGVVLSSSWNISASAVTATAALGNAPWPMFQHDLLHTGRSPYLGAQAFHLKWSFDVGGEGLDSTPAIDSNGNLYVQSRSGYLYSLYPNGTLRWKFPTFESCCVGGFLGLESSPAISSNGMVYVGSTDGNLYSIFSNGTLSWRYTTGGPIQSSPSIGPDGTIYFGSNDGNLYAITQRGQLKWKLITGDAVVSSPAIDFFGNSSVATIYVGSNDAKLYAVSLAGGLKWTFRTGGALLSSPAIGLGGIVYIGSRDGSVYAVNRGGSLVWSFPVSSKCGIDASPAIGPKGTVYVGVGFCSDGFYAINRNGTLLWKYPSPEIRSSATVGSDGIIYVGVDDPVYAFNPDGTVKWAGGCCFVFYSSPTIALDGTIYIGTEYHGTLLAIS